MISNKVGFVGLSHLGLVTSIAFSLKNIKVTAYHHDLKEVFDANNKLIIQEPDLQTSLRENKNINFTDNIKELNKCYVIYVSYDIPTNKNGKADYSIILKILNKLNKVLSKNKIIVIHSQIYPGFMRKLKLKFKYVYYHVETLVFGNALSRAKFPERIIIGKKEFDEQIETRFYKLIVKFNCPIIEMNYESAELCKISINLLLISSISISNVLSRVSENIGADWYDIIKALKLDRRIGEYSYIFPNLGLSGGNLERDLKVVETYVTNKPHLSLIKSFKSISKFQSNYLYDIIDKKLHSNPQISIGLLGATYKENTNSIKNSPSIKLINRYANYNIHFYDPVYKQYKKIKSSQNMKDLISKSEILIIMTPWFEFSKIDLSYLKKHFFGKIIIDPFRLLKLNYKLNLSFKYITLGKTV